MVIDGRVIAEEIYASLRERRGSFGDLSLGILVSGANPVIEQFVDIKKKSAESLSVALVRVDLPEEADTEAARVAVGELAARTDAIIVQLPLLPHLDTDAVLSAIPIEKDVDAIHPRIAEEARPVHSPVARAVLEILARAGVSIRGKRAVVVGKGRLVGAPAARVLQMEGSDVTFFTLEEGAVEDLKEADIVVCGAGRPGLVKPENLKEGVALIDAGASEQGGAIRGDADPACAEKASVFTPVPGGVGPIAVAMIFKNLLDLAARK